MACTPLQFITSIESALEEALGKQAAFSQNPLCLNRVFQFHEGAAYLRLQRSLENGHPPELVATIAVRSVSGENGSQAIQGECSHVSLKRTVPFFFTQPEEEGPKQKLLASLESLFEEAASLEGEQPQLETGSDEDKKALEAVESDSVAENSEKTAVAPEAE